MDQTENSINNREQSLNPCNEKSPALENPNLDEPQGGCGPGEPSFRAKLDSFDAWQEVRGVMTKTGLGSHNNCDPVMTGQIVNDPCKPNPNMAYRYSQAIRACDEGTMDLFRNIIVIDENGLQHKVPIIWGTQEKAVAYVLQDNVRKDKTLVVDRIRLPILSIHQSDIQMNLDHFTYSQARTRGRRPDGKPAFTIDEKFERDTVFGVSRGIPIDITYTLNAWTLYIEDMNQILEQILLKFNHVAYINVRGINWEVIAKLNSIGNNIEVEPGDQAIRVIKYQFNITVESYIPQPILRQKAVLKMGTEIVNNDEDYQISDILDKIEVAVKELE